MAETKFASILLSRGINFFNIIACVSIFKTVALHFSGPLCARQVRVSKYHNSNKKFLSAYEIH